MRRLLCLLFAALVPVAAAAQDRANTILVLDGSGSMWGQIDGVNKIVIARDVVGELLNDFPADQNLGLTVYGHRTRGDCTDIETVVAPGENTIDAIRSAVSAINPRGKTPMTDAIIAAAEALRYTEEKATVILVSDGIETCNPDPCAAARALEQAGIDFTAHVVGFDVTDPEALAQMQCLAAETGGTFTTAANAQELSTALASVTIEPEPITVSATFRAVLDSADGALITDPVLWEITSDAGVIAADEAANPLTLDLLEGTHTATAYWTVQETEASQQFTVDGAAPISVTIIFDTPLPEATVSGPESAPMGATVPVDWTGPNEDGDRVVVAIPGERDYETVAYTRDGNPAQLQMPPRPGQYELRYLRGAGYDPLVIGPLFEVTPVEVGLDAPDSATLGDTIDVSWIGPDYPNDYIAIGLPGERSYENYTYTKDGTPASLLMPSEPGTYELRYIMSQETTVIATRPITITDLEPQLVAPATAIAGETIQVGWDGPDYDLDYIAVSEAGERGYVNYTYTREGNPLGLEMPAEPGEYEIRYILNQDSEVLASIPITVTPLEVQLTGPETAIAGETVQVGWTGPDYDLDYIAVSEAGERGYVNYTYTREGNPLALEMPAEPGAYEIRYILNQDSAVAAAIPITVTPLKVTLSAQAEAPLGATIPVEWDGPDYPQDYIAVSEMGERGYVNYTYTRDGSPAMLQLPPEPGEYEIRYILNQDSTVASTITITVTDLKPQLVHDPVAPAGGDLVVGWDGPDYHQDFITIVKSGERGYGSYAYTRTGNPLTIAVPDEPGDYEVRYVLNQDSTVLATSPLTVE